MQPGQDPHARFQGWEVPHDPREREHGAGPGAGLDLGPPQQQHAQQHAAPPFGPHLGAQFPPGPQYQPQAPYVPGPFYAQAPAFETRPQWDQRSQGSHLSMQSMGKGARFGPDFQPHRPPAGQGGLNLERMNRPPAPAPGLQQAFAQGGPPPRPPATVGPTLDPRYGPGIGPPGNIAPGVLELMGQLTVGQQQMQQLMLRSQSAPATDRSQQRSHIPKQLHALNLPDPKGNWINFKRKADEAIIEADSLGALPFQKVRWLADALPVHDQNLLRDFMSVARMQETDALANIMTWLEARHGPTAGAEELEVTESFDYFRRTSADFEMYVDNFEAHVQRLIAIGEPLTEAQKRRFLIAKADLPKNAKAKLLSTLLQIRKCKGVSVDVYSDVKESLIALGKESNHFVRVNATEEAQNVNYSSSGPYRPSSASRPACRHFARGNCTRGGACRFAHDAGRGQTPERGQGSGRGYERSRSPRASPRFERQSSRSPGTDRFRANFRDGFRQRSPPPRGSPSPRFSPRPSPQRGTSPQRDRSGSPRERQVCFDFQAGRCNRGANCKFSHSGGGGRQREFSGSRVPSRTPRTPPQGGARGSPSRSPVPSGGRR